MPASLDPLRSSLISISKSAYQSYLHLIHLLLGFLLTYTTAIQLESIAGLHNGKGPHKRYDQRNRDTFAGSPRSIVYTFAGSPRSIVYLL
jgi:hypothetical protein